MTSQLSADDFGQTDGLQQMGDVWVLPKETELRVLASRLPLIAREFQDGQATLLRLLDLQRRNWKASQLRIVQLNNNIRRLADGDPRQAELQATLKSINEFAIPPEDFGGVLEIRKLLQQQCRRQCELIISVNRLRNEVAQLEQQYQALRENKANQQLLVGTNQRIGPWRPMAGLLKSATKVNAVAFANTVPLWRQGSTFRLSGVVNETEPIAVSFDPSLDTFRITWGDADRLGIEPTMPTTTKIVRVQGKDFALQHTKIEYLQIGARQLREIDAWILPPAGEYLGSAIGGSSFPTDQPVILAPACELRVVSP